ncbi:pectate lyase [Boeremia exigua]|uniref:pectate lyase n=1 Tax=Boeremia exigua TaxID=749465 RepID=UPI001E8DF462|nr:pectate lyase [Boeremia exigua]KAH6644239.1 pectate lyase [Boeremia exigua]
MRFEYSLVGAAVSGVALGQTLNIPTRVGSIVALPTASVISGSRDFGNKEYDRGRSCAIDVEPQGPTPVFILEDGASISNVIIGRNQVDGIQCKGACTLTNVWFREVCESAVIALGKGDILIKGGGAQKAADGIVNHQGRGTVTIADFTAVDVNKLYRSCGGCANNGGPRNVVGSCGVGVKKVCQEYKGVQKGSEAVKVATTANCKGQTSFSAC